MKRTPLLVCVGILGFCSQVFGQQGPPGRTQTLEQAIEQSHRALHSILNGNPKLYEELFADREDISLGNPFGPFARGRKVVVKTLAGAAGKYRDGSATVDLIATYQGGTLACILEVENDHAKVGGSDSFADFSVRVTSLYEKIGNEWKLVHRHADPITSPRPAESVLQK
jgi:ketosteroid isomerase-like protein